MPENKEELYGILYEFDDQIRAMAKMLNEYDGHDTSMVENAWLIVYTTYLCGLMKCYNEFDQFLARQIQNGES